MDRVLPSGELQDLKLKHVKRVATGLLLLAAAIYVAATMLAPRYPSFHYLAATCEAAMVGAFADWFAVVALFRHPLNVPLPHTAIIPRNKARIAENLGRFVQEKFLSTPALLARIREFNPAGQLSAWLLKRENAVVLASYATRAMSYGLSALDDERVRGFLYRTVSAKLYRLDLATLLGQLLDVLTENQRHHVLLDQALVSLHELLLREETRQYLIREIGEQMPGLRWLNEYFHLDEKAANKILDVAIARLGEVRENPDHELRKRFDELFADFIRKLKTDSATRVKIDQLREDVLANPAVKEYLGGLWMELRNWLDADLAKGDSVVHERIVDLASTLGARLDADPRIKEWINEQIIAAAPPLVEQHRASFGRFIERQINEWQEATLVKELERNIGADLQYIRINGTLVGGAAGLAIYSLTRWLS
jgi:uncharacterized membrane-anchored protein YjiN (DUF445 family)